MFKRKACGNLSKSLDPSVKIGVVHNGPNTKPSTNSNPNNLRDAIVSFQPMQDVRTARSARYNFRLLTAVHAPPHPVILVPQNSTVSTVQLQAAHCGACPAASSVDSCSQSTDTAFPQDLYRPSARDLNTLNSTIMGASFSSIWFPRRCQHRTECSLTFSRSAREGEEGPSATDEEAPHAREAPHAVENMQWIQCADPSGCLYMRNISNGYHTYQLQIPESAMNVSPLMTTFPIQGMDPTGLLVSPRVARANTEHTAGASFPPLDLPEPAAAHRIHESEASARQQQHHQRHQRHQRHQCQQQHQQYQYRHQLELEDWWGSLDEADGNSCSPSVAGYSQYEDPYIS